MKSEKQKILLWGAVGGVFLTIIFFSRFGGALTSLLAFPIYFAFATKLAEGVISFRAGAGFGERSGLGLSAWCFFFASLFALFVSFVT